MAYKAHSNKETQENARHIKDGILPQANVLLDVLKLYCASQQKFGIPFFAHVFVVLYLIAHLKPDGTQVHVAAFKLSHRIQTNADRFIY